MLALALTSCADPPRDGEGDTAELLGTVTYLQRVALPPGAVVHVRLEDVSRADSSAVTIAEQIIPADGRQVPIQFSLSYDSLQIDPGHVYEVRAEIRDGNDDLGWTTDAPPRVLTQGAPSDGIEVRVVQVAGTPDEVSAVAVWERARRSGVDFRGVGQEPGWLVEIREGEHIRFLYDYGRQEVTMPAPQPDEQDQQTVYRTEAQGRKLTVTITTETCTDTMSGERFEASVMVNLDGESFRGCGRSLQ